MRSNGKVRCQWCGDDPLYVHYHDTEWGVPVRDDQKLFEFLIGAPYLGGATENWFAYMLALVFLVFRPQGLFGEKIIERV